MSGFSWTPFFEEMLSVVCQRYDKHSLCQLFHEIFADSGGRDDTFADDTQGPLQEIDPLTFVAYFLRGISKAKCIGYCTTAKSSLELSSSVPEGFDGVAGLINSQNTWFFGRAKNREEGTIEKLWEFANSLNNDAVGADLFREVLGIRNVGIAKLTAVMFACKPDQYVVFDSKKVDFLRHSGIEVPDPEKLGQQEDAFGQYQDIVRAIKQRFPDRSLAEISHEAFLYSQKGGSVRRKPIWARRVEDDNNFDLQLVNHNEVDWDHLEEELKRVEQADISKGLNKEASGPIRKLRNTPLRPILPARAYAILCNWFTTEGPSYQKSPRRDAAREFWSLLFEAVPEKGLTYREPDRYEEIDPAKFHSWWQEQLAKQSRRPGTGTDGPGEGPTIPQLPLCEILYGPPGTGKTYEAYRRAVEIVDGRASPDRAALMRRYTELVELGRIAFVTFHQSYSYEEFVEGIRPVLDDGQLRYKLRDGMLKRMARSASGASGGTANPAQDQPARYVLIVDEINRGNVSSVLGETITLLDPDKRVGAINETQVVLPYSQGRFGLPNNLYVIGTMNTADRSIALMDVALRRRFAFRHFAPEPQVLRAVLAGRVEGDLVDLLTVVLETLNRRIQVLLDEDHQIGHSYFLTVQNEQDLLKIWYDQIVPLVQEYFYNDWERLERLLGSQFVRRGNGQGYQGLFAEGNGPDELPGRIHRAANPQELIILLKEAFGDHA